MDIDYYRKLLQKYRDGTCSDEERRLLDEWYDRLGEGLPLPAPGPEEKEELTGKSWDALLNRRDDLHAEVAWQEAGRWRRARFPLMVAAGISALLLVLGTVFFLPGKQEKAVSEKTEVSEEPRFEAAPGEGARLLVLSDGSRVTLMEGARLQYGASFGDRVREVFLSGEAYFEVAENAEKPFFVHANKVVTKVLGTSFLVKAPHNSGEVEVSVTKGKVSVYKPVRDNSLDPSGEAVILLPRQQVLYPSSANMPVQSEVEDPARFIPTEKPERLVFENAPLLSILEAMESAYQVKFELNGERLGACTLTTSLEDESLGEVLVIISRLLDMEYSVDGNMISLRGNGC